MRISFLSKPKVQTWLLVVGVATLLLLASYAMLQQDSRQEADDLPISTAQTVQAELTDGNDATDIVTPIKTNLSQDDTVFTIITDDSEHILASSAQLGGHSPLPPADTFNYAKAHGSDKFTWSPSSGVRLATYVLPYGSGSDAGYIVTGQSLSEVQNQARVFGEITLAGFVAVVAWSTLILTLRPSSRKK